MPKITNEEIGPARRAIRALKEYRHPVSGRGLRQDPALLLTRLDRALREAAKDYEQRFNELVAKWGTEKIEGDPQSAWVPKDSPDYPRFAEDVAELNEVEIEIPDSLVVKRADMKVRDEKGELEEADVGIIGDLGALLLDVEPGAEPSKRGGRARRAPAGTE